MPWTLQFNSNVAPGTMAQTALVTTSNQAFALIFPQYAADEVRLFGVGLWRVEEPPGALGGPSVRRSLQLWNTRTTWNLANGDVAGAVWVYVPENFGSSPQVAVARLDP